jgi:hypothetical protein
MNKVLTLLFFCGLQNICFGQFIIFGNPAQSNITNNGFTVTFSTNTSAQTLIKYGLTSSLELGYIGNGQSTTSHSINLSGLSPATFYYVRPCVVDGVDTVQSTKTGFYSTASNSTGAIKVYFTKTIDTDPSVAGGTFPHISNSPAAIQAELIKRIDSAKSKIDCAVYNNNTSAIVTALNNAHNRGVRVRYIADDGTSNTALSAAQFPNLLINPLGFMHNKFMVVDPDSVNSSYVWTGSMNWTSGNINDDYNNVVVFQDQALAKAYVIEFEEMWGSNGATANSPLSKAGAAKADNTPHLFIIGGKLVESYFSPSDKTTQQIERALLSAGGDLQFALLTCTNDDLGNAIINRHQSGETVAGIIDNIGDQGTEYTPMLAAGVDVLADNQSPEVHHKYGIVDANTPSSDPMVITGSHNWSAAAETVNDENTVIIHDAEIANWFLQEFSKRYCTIKGTANCHYSPAVSTEIIENNVFALSLYPNPAADKVSIALSNIEAGKSLRLRVFNSLGQQMTMLSLNENTVTEISVSSWPAGSYFIRIEADGISKTEKLMIVR